MKFVIFISFIFVGIGLQAEEKRKTASLVKTPKSLFLIKKAKITSDVGEPLFYPADAQLRTITNDQLIHNIKKFE